MMRDTLVMLTTAAVLFLVLMLTSSCAIGRVHPDGSMEGIAIGHAALERTACQPVPPDMNANCEVRIHGGAISNNFAEFLGAAMAAIGAYFGIGAL